jgi:subtilisin family serine protease
MHRRIPVLALLAVFGLAACSTDGPVSPLKAPTAPKLDVSSGSSSGRYVVVMKGTSVPAGFAQAVANLGGKITSSHDGAGLATVSGLTAASAATLAASTGVSEVQPDAAVTLEQPIPTIQADAAALAAPGVDSQAAPATALLASWQWNMRLIQADKAWAAGKLGSPSVTVAILDTGLDYDNRDLTGLVDLNRSVSFMNTFVGGPDDVVTLSDDDITTTFFPTRNKISDYNGHGTNVGATVSSKAFAFAGVTSQTTLIGVKVLGANGVGSFGGILNGVLWAADHGADVANMSLGGSFEKAGNGQLIHAIKKVFDYAARKGMLIVVSAGNDGTNLDRNADTFSTFCDAPHVICVASVGPVTVDGNPDLPAFYTNFGRRSIDVAAPGGNADLDNLPISNWPWGPDFASWVWSFCSKTSLVFSPTGAPGFAGCQAGNRLNGYIGTSQASPHVTGLAALLVAQNWRARPDKLKDIIEDSGDRINPKFGEGRINVANALGLNGKKHDGRDDDHGGPGRH